VSQLIVGQQMDESVRADKEIIRVQKGVYGKMACEQASHFFRARQEPQMEKARRRATAIHQEERERELEMIREEIRCQLRGKKF
jgi:hypothetical protein